MLAKYFLVGVIVAGSVLAQIPFARPAFGKFEVATIKPTAPDWDGGNVIRMESTNRFAVLNYTLKRLVAAAYNLTPGTISGGPA